MLRLTSKITINNVVYTTLVECTIESSLETFTNTATLVFPTILRQKNQNIIDKIKIGDSVKIELGYYPYISTLFEGFISKIEPKNPVSISCEDFAWKLKQQTVKEYNSNSVTVKQLLTDLSLPCAFLCVDATLGKIRISNATVAEVLDNLKDTYGLVSYFIGGTLIVGTIQRTDKKRINIQFNGQKGVVIEDNLLYMRSDSLQLYVKGISFKPDNTKIELYGYYENGEIKITEKEKSIGEQRIFNYYNITKDELTNRLTEILPQIYYEGYTGSFTTFLRPEIRFGDEVSLKDLKFPEREGVYLVKAVTTNFGQSGGRQQVTLDIKV